ncbi:MAG: type II toxin-antitoxin system PemK/MazF family toxin [Pseudonocardiaceae bacterium]|nr:type II toxin-antitoxin system PemK/MazF family toxin [Pseudonocardiaceae bacterium]
MKRGDIYQLRANPQARGHEQRGRRYAVLVQSDALMLSTVIAAPTSTGSWTSSFHPEIGIEGQRSRVLLEQLQAIDPQRRLGRYVGRVSPEEQHEIDHALNLVLGLF